MRPNEGTIPKNDPVIGTSIDLNSSEKKQQNTPTALLDLEFNEEKNLFQIKNQKISADFLDQLIQFHQNNPKFENFTITKCFFEEKELATLGKFLGTHLFIKSFELSDVKQSENSIPNERICLFLSSLKESKSLQSIALNFIIFDDHVAKSLAELLTTLNFLKNLTVTNQFTFISKSTNFGKRVFISKGFSFKGLELIATALKTNTNLQYIQLEANSFAQGFGSSQVNKIYQLIVSNTTLLQFDLGLFRDPRVDYNKSSNYYWEEEEVFEGRYNHLDQGHKFPEVIIRNKLFDELINKKSITWPTKPVYWSYSAIEKLFSIDFPHKFLILDRLVEIKKTLPLINNYIKSTSYLITLDLSHYKLDGNLIQQICAALTENRSISNLHLVNTGINDEHTPHIAELLGKDSNLPLGYLNLSRNHLTSKGLGFISEKLEENTKLYHLNIQDNKVENEGLITLAHSLTTNQYLTTLDLLDNLQISLNPKNQENLNKTLSTIKEFISILNSPLDRGKKKNSKRKSTGDEKGKNTRLTCINLIPSELPPKPDVWDSYDKKEKEKQINTYYQKKQTEITKLSQTLQQYLDENNKKRRELISVITLKKSFSEFTQLLKTVSLYTYTENGDSLLHLAVNKSAFEILSELIKRKINPNLINNKGLTAIETCKDEETEEDKKIYTLLGSYQTEFLSPDSKHTQINIDDSIKKRQKISIGSIALSPLKPLEIDNENKNEKLLTPTMASSSSSSCSSSSSSALVSTSFSSITVPMLDQAEFFDLIITGGKFQLAKAIKNQPQLMMIYGFLGFHQAVRNNQKDCALILLEQGVNLEEADEKKYTPLYSVISDPDKENLDMALLLIKKGAKTSTPTFDYEFKVNRFTALHKAVATGKYRSMKIILSASDCDPNLTDENELSALDWAIDRYHLPMISRLLIERTLKPVTIQRCLDRITRRYQDDKMNPNFQTLERLLKERLQAKFPDQYPGIQWSKRLKIVFGSHYGKNKKTVTIDNEAEHAELCLQNEFSRQRLFKLSNSDEKEQDDVKGNPVTASLIFITSRHKYVKGANEERIPLRIGLDFIDKHHFDLSTVNPQQKQDELIHRVSSAPPAFFNHTAKKRKYRPLSPEEIREKYKQVETQGNKVKGLVVGFPLHHGEQALLSHLEDPETAKRIVTSLAQHPQFVYGSKVYGVILNVHSPRYCCENCEVAILGEQNYSKSKFLQNLSFQLKQLGCALPVYSDLRMLTQVSSYIPFHRDAIDDSDELVTQVDFRACNNNLILSKDMNSVEPQATQYHSNRSLALN